MSNTNRDYVIVYDVKNSTLVLSRPLVFYITDKNTSNIFVRLVTKTNIGNGVDQYTDIENASSYILLMRTIKPNDEVINIKATQREPESIFEFDLTEDFINIPGTYICELMISTIVNGRQELITSDSFTYKVKRSVLSRIDEIIEHEETTVEKLLNELDATKAELDSKVNKGEKGAITNAMLSQEVKEAMTGGSVAVVGVDSVLEPNIVDGAVTPRKTNFVKQINLFNYATSTAGKRIADTTGTLVDDASFSTSDFIEVSPSSKYTLNIANYDTVFIYNSSKTVIEKLNLSGHGIVVNTITTPVNAKYIRLSYLNEYDAEIMFVEGEKLPEKYYSAQAVIMDGLRVSNNNMADKVVAPNNTTFFKKINLLNYKTSAVGKRIADMDGGLIADASFDTSDFIEVEPLKNYTLNIANYDTAFVYDSSKTIIQKLKLNGWGIVVNTITMPENAKYVRLCYLNEHKTKIMFVEGDKIPNEYCSYDDFVLENSKQNVFDEKTSLEGAYLFFGDSICYGAGYQGGYSKIIAENNPKMTHVNYGVSGSSVAKRASRSDSVLEKVAAAQDEADFIVLEGGVNDAWSSEIALGDFNASSPLTSSYISSLVDTTYTGALETLFNNVQTKWPGKLVFFIIPHNMDLPNTKSFMDRAAEVCQKWGVILIDLRKLSGMNTYNEYINTNYTNAGDGVHPNRAGYEKFYIKPITNILSQYK